jgi:hypothetical protein
LKLAGKISGKIMLVNRSIFIGSIRIGNHYQAEHVNGAENGAERALIPGKRSGVMSGM